MKFQRQRPYIVLLAHHAHLITYCTQLDFSLCQYSMVWPSKPQILTVWPGTEKVCRLLIAWVKENVIIFFFENVIIKVNCTCFFFSF